MPKATVSSKSQIVLPAEIRRRLGIRPGDRLTIEVEDEHIVLRKAPGSDLEALATFRGSVWRDQAVEVGRARDEWDR
jgi:AbrB family looped-hinge helix DNA binding protein